MDSLPLILPIMTNWHVGVIDDHPVCRSAIVVLLKTFGILAEAFADADSLSGAGTLTDWDCVIVDLHLSGTTGWQEIAKLRMQRADLPVIIMTANLDNVFSSAEANHLAPLAFVSKSATAEQILSTIQQVVHR